MDPNNNRASDYLMLPSYLAQDVNMSGGAEQEQFPMEKGWRRQAIDATMYNDSQKSMHLLFNMKISSASFG